MKSSTRLSAGASAIAASGGLLYGYDMGIISGALLQLRVNFEMSCLMQEIVVSSVLFGAVISSVIGGAVIDWIGRKLTMIINCVFFIIGAVILSFSSSVAFLITGRILLGFAVALTVIAECAYISEISSPKHRGKLVSLNEVAIALGFLIAYLVNYLCISMDDGWRVMFGVSGILALVLGFALVFVPKSPRFLIIKSSEDEALKVLKRLRENEAIAKEELSALQQALAIEKKFGWRELFSLKDNMAYRLLIGFGLVTLQQCSGLPSVMYYSPVVLKYMGFESDESATLASVGAGVTKTVAVIISLLLVDKVGRRKLLITGCVIMALSLFIMAELNRGLVYTASESCQDNGTHGELMSANTTQIPNLLVGSTQTARTVSLVSLLCYVAAYSIGYGPVTWIILSEVFPPSIKGRAIAVVCSINYIVNLLISFTFLSYLERVGLSWTLCTYGIACCTGIVFVILFVPETKGRTLEDINSTINSVSLLQEMKRHCVQACCCCQTINRSDSYEPLSNSMALETLSLTSSNLSTITEQIT